MAEQQPCLDFAHEHQHEVRWPQQQVFSLVFPEKSAPLQRKCLCFCQQRRQFLQNKQRKTSENSTQQSQRQQNVSACMESGQKIFRNIWNRIKTFTGLTYNYPNYKPLNHYSMSVSLHLSSQYYWHPLIWYKMSTVMVNTNTESLKIQNCINSSHNCENVKCLLVTSSNLISFRVASYSRQKFNCIKKIKTFMKLN